MSTATSTSPVYFSTAATAKLIRATLKAEFPATKFSVRSHNYAGGSSVYVSWTDGPTEPLVDAIVSDFNGRGFDGMIDMAFTIDAWTLKGEILGTRCAGTVGSRGTVSPWGMIPPHDDAELVHFSPSVSTSRTVSAQLAEKCVAQVAAFYGITETPVVVAERGGYKLEGPKAHAAVIGRDDWNTLIYRASRDRTTYQRAEI